MTQWFNSALIQMGNHLRNNYDNVFLGIVEAPPGPDQALADAQASGLPQVKFVPLMGCIQDFGRNGKFLRPELEKCPQALGA